MKKVVVVLDIGKTNKKIALYDREGKLLEIFSKGFPSEAYEELRVEQVASIESWFLDSLRNISREWDVAGISITTHGATAVCVGDDGKPAVPVIDYTTEVDESIHEKFYIAAGDPDHLHAQTCTPEVRPLINLAKLLFFTKERFPSEFKNVRKILFYPQYFAYRLCGKMHADFTYVGCHTYLWDFAKNDWSDVVQKLGLRDLFPSTVSFPGSVAGHLTDAVAEKTGLDRNTPVLVGVHDSNSSLIPYLLSGPKDFMLDSTGTWCVAMHPEKNAILKREDIGKTVLFNLSVFNKPVKTAIFLGGLELETWMSVLGAIHDRKDFPPFSPALAQTIILEKRDFILPGVVQGAGQFPSSFAAVMSAGKTYTLQDIREENSIPTLFTDYEKAFTVLLLSLALHTKVAFLRAGLIPGIPIYIEGKFRQNFGYTSLVASLFPENEIFVTGIDEATSFGAAILGWAAFDRVDLSSLSSMAKFEKIPVTHLELDGLDEYATAYLMSIKS